MMRLAVFGARSGSLGAAVAEGALKLGAAEEVRTYGISGDEDVMYAAGSPHISWTYDLLDFDPTDVFVTTGINLPKPFDATLGFDNAMWESFQVNVMGPLTVLRECTSMGFRVRSFSAVSSNSAHIARTGSAPYCASKAALSMALRVAARERVLPLIYGYEFGLLQGTPMTDESRAAFDGPLTRMKGAEDGLPLDEVARLIIGNLMEPSIALNGAMLRLDAGEQ